ncbi:MAG TPA: calcium-binding protein [Phycisphaerae bacterium]|nr:calcium-binding protein [Phycisphaerae bacterium]
MPVELDEVEYGEWDGTDGNDVHYDINLFDVFNGYDGDDVFYVSATDHDSSGYGYYPDDWYFGGDGNDTISYQQSTLKIVADLTSGIISRMEDGPLQGSYTAQSTDRVYSMENLNGSNYDDVITGSDGANLLRGLGGNDTINGGGGDDHVWGDSGNDALLGGDGNDTVDGGTGNDTMDGGTGNDIMNGESGNDSMTGKSGHDTMNGGDGNDAMIGGSGNDTMNGGNGNDTIDGGDGSDTVVYNTAGDVIVNLWHGNASGALGNDTLSNIERVETGSGNDTVFGSASSNTINVGSGNDTVYGYQGNDLIYAGVGNDTVWGGNDADTVYGEDGNDVLKGEAGNDFLFGGNGADRIRGGDGNDTINGNAGADVIEYLAGDEGSDTISGFNLGEDHLYFGDGFFAVDPGGAVDLEDVLMVAYSGDDALLFANTAEDGWTLIATLLDVSVSQLDAMIENETILGPVPIYDFGNGLPTSHDLLV